MTLGVFQEIEHLIEFIPVSSRSHDRHDARLETETSIDSSFAFTDKDGISTRLGVIGRNPDGSTCVSLRDIIRLLNKFFKDASIEELIPKYNNGNSTLQESSLKVKAQTRGLLFDYCLAALDGDTFDAKSYLTHLIHFASLRRRLNLVLAISVNDPGLKDDKDIRRMLTLLARIAEPDNVDKYFDAENSGFHGRYVTYLKEMNKLDPIYNIIRDNSNREEPLETSRQL